MNRPHISIITVCYNAAKTFEQTIQSIANQKIAVEFIVVDGGSWDGTIEIATKYQDIISVFISEPDNGIYDAMNKGIAKAKGEWLYFLGADDKLSEGILTEINNKFDSDLAVIYGDVIYDTGYKVRSHLGFRTLLENTLHHQGAFYNRNLFAEFRYDTKYSISSDYELNLQIYLQKLPSMYIPYIIAVCGSVGASSVISSKETNHIRSKYIKNPVVAYSFSLALSSYYLYFKAKKALKSSLMHIFSAS